MMDYPECWQDDDRMDVLFAPFRPRALNVDSFDAKLDFWTNLILKYCENSKTMVIGVPMLKKVFERNHKSPYCLDLVLNEMCKKNQIQEYSAFIDDLNASNSWFQWIFKLTIKKAFGALKNTLYSKDLNTISYVVPNAMRKVKHNLFEKIKSSKSIKIQGNFLLPVDKIEELIKNEETFKTYKDFLLSFILSQKEISSSHVEICGKNIFLLKYNVNNITSSVTEMDKEIYLLKSTILLFENRLNEIEKTINNLILEAKNAVANKKRHLALRILKRKKCYEVSYEKKSNLLHNLEVLNQNIDDAETDKNVLMVYKSGMNRLSESLKELQSMKYEETLDNLQDLIKINEDITNEISEGFDGSFNEDELEHELSLLMKGDVTLPKKIDSSELNLAKTRTSEEIQLINLVDNLELCNNEIHSKITTKLENPL